MILGQLLEERLRCERGLRMPVHTTLDGTASQETMQGRWLPLRWRGPCARTVIAVRYIRVNS